MKRLG